MSHPAPLGRPALLAETYVAGGEAYHMTASGRVGFVDVRSGYVADDHKRLPAAMPIAHDYRRSRVGGYGTTTSAVAQLSPPRPSRTTTAAR